MKMINNHVIVSSSIYGNVSFEGGEEAINTLEEIKTFNENTLIGVKRGDEILIIPVRSLDLEAVTLIHES